jgi:LysM repeat protein
MAALARRRALSLASLFARSFGGSAVSSLRPLATITLLAVVGVVLYMKINETEPVIPEGVGEWSNQLEIGADGGAAAAPGVGLSEAPALEAPPFNPAAPAGGTAAAPAPAGDAAPAWKPEPLLSSKTDDATEKAEAEHDHAGHDHAHDEESSPVARSADVPDMPPLPESNSTAKSSDAATPPVVAVPFVNTPGNSTPSTAAADAAPPASSTTPAPAAANPYAAAPDASASTMPEPSPIDAAATPAPTSGAAPEANAALASEPITPTDSAKGSMYASARVAVQADLDRGELGKALVKLSEWYGDPSLTPEETQEVETLLGQLAGDVIYEGPPAHRLAPKHVVATGETLETIAQKYNVPWQLLAKINRIADPAAVQVGQELKVMQGPFSAIVDLGKRRMTLMLDRCYAGKFNIELDPTASIEEGSWKVDQKLLTPIVGGVYGQPAGATEDRGLLLTNPANPASQPAMLRGPGMADQVSAPPAARVIRFKATDVEDVYDILSVGSTITIRR